MKNKKLIPIITILVLISIVIVMFFLQGKENPETAGAKECIRKLSELTDIAFDDMEDIQEINMSEWGLSYTKYTVTEPQDFEKILNTLNVSEFKEIYWPDGIEGMIFGGYSRYIHIVLNSGEKIDIEIIDQYVCMNDVYYESTPELVQSIGELYKELSESYEVTP